MTDKNRLLHIKHSEELIKLSDKLDDLNMNNEPYKSIVDNTLDYERERTARDDYFRMENTNIVAKLNKFYYNVARSMYKRLENRANPHIKNRISASPIVQSSQKSIVTFSDPRSTRISPDVYKIADLIEEEEVTNNYFVNEENENCYSIPLEEIVCKNTDRKIIVYTGNHKLKDNERRNNKEHAYEFGWAFNLHSEQKKTNQQDCSGFFE